MTIFFFPILWYRPYHSHLSFFHSIPCPKRGNIIPIPTSYKICSKKKKKICNHPPIHPAVNPMKLSNFIYNNNNNNSHQKNKNKKQKRVHSNHTFQIIWRQLSHLIEMISFLMELTIIQFNWNYLILSNEETNQPNLLSWSI